MVKVKVLLLAGGFGRKLWPLARRDFPKPFLKLLDDRSLLRLTVERFLWKFSPDDIYLVTEDKYRFLVDGELRGTGVHNYIFEPASRGTLNSILFALRFMEEEGELPDVLVVAPTDQVVESAELFHRILERAIRYGTDRGVTLIGIPPEYPGTEFGYVMPGGELEEEVFVVERFVEKPSYEEAGSYVKKGGWLWNMGVFVINPSLVLKDLNAILKENMGGKVPGLEEMREKFSSFPILNFAEDYVQNATDRVVVRANFKWSSLNNWLAIHRWLKKDGDNVVRGNVTWEDVHNSLIFGENRKIVALSVDDVVVVETRDALFVSKLSESYRLRDVVDLLYTRGEQEFVEHKTVFRPWGSYTVLEEDVRFKVKRISIEPGGTLSLQYHNHRSEHWVVVRGKVKAEVDGREMVLETGESTFVPRGKLHRLSNPFEEMAEIVEVQVGDYLGEDDIVRVEDIYGRNKENGGR